MRVIQEKFAPGARRLFDRVGMGAQIAFYTEKSELPERSMVLRGIFGEVLLWKGLPRIF